MIDLIMYLIKLSNCIWKEYMLILFWKVKSHYVSIFYIYFSLNIKLDRKKSQRNTCYLKKHLASTPPPPHPRSVCALIYTLAASDFIENNVFLTKHI